jgi:hypothetical protein
MLSRSQDIAEIRHLGGAGAARELGTLNEGAFTSSAESTIDTIKEHGGVPRRRETEGPKDQRARLQVAICRQPWPRRRSL